MPDSDNQALGRQIKRGVTWSGAELALRMVFRIGLLAILARLLTPAEFGAFAAAMTVIELALPLSTLSLEHAMVQQPDAKPPSLAMAALTACVAALVIALLVYVGAPLVAWVYPGADVTLLVRRLALAIPLAALSALGLAVLRRRLAFSALSVIAFVSFLASAVVMVSLAVNGHGVWSLVAGYFTELCTSAVLALATARPKFVMPRWSASTTSMLRFGAGQTTSSMLNYWALQGDYIVIGRALGASALGFYSRAYQLVSVLPTFFARFQSVVLFPTFSQHDTSTADFSRRLLAGVEALGALAAPACGLAAVLAPDLIALVLGPGWERVIRPFQILTLGIFFRSGHNVAASVIMARGQVAALSVCQGLYAAAVVGGALVSVRYAGIVGVALSTLLALAFFYLLLFVVVLRNQRQVSAVAFAAAHARGLLIGIATVSIAGAVFLASESFGPLLRLSITVGATLLALTVATLSFKDKLWGPLLYSFGSKSLNRIKHGRHSDLR